MHLIHAVQSSHGIRLLTMTSHINMSRKQFNGNSIDHQTTTFIQPLENINTDPMIKFASHALTSKVLQGLTTSQLNLFKKTAPLTIKVGKTEKEKQNSQRIEENYHRYLSGSLKHSIVILDPETINKSLKRKELLVNKAPNGGLKSRIFTEKSINPKFSITSEDAVKQVKKTFASAVVSKSKIIADRYKASSFLSEKWSKIESTRAK